MTDEEAINNVVAIIERQKEFVWREFRDGIVRVVEEAAKREAEARALLASLADQAEEIVGTAEDRSHLDSECWASPNCASKLALEEAIRAARAFLAGSGETKG